MRSLIDFVGSQRRRVAGAMRPAFLLAVAVAAPQVQAQGLPSSMYNANQDNMIGVFRPFATDQLSYWYMNTTGDHQSLGQPTQFGLGGDQPIMGDWNNNGQLKVGVFRSGYWYMDMVGNGTWSPSNNYVYGWGLPGDIPVVGDWLHNGTLLIGVYRVDSNGYGWWYVNLHSCTDSYGCGWGGFSGTATETLGVDYEIYQFGLAGDIPVVGDWGHTGSLRMGVVRNGMWIVDMGGCNNYNPACVQEFDFGTFSGYQPVVGRWTGGSDATHLNVGMFISGAWYVDANGDGNWGAGDFTYNYGLPADIAVMATLPAGAAPVSITSPATLPAGTVSTAYSQTLTASGGVPPYSWSVVSGSLPGGLGLSSSGLLSGTPTAAGSFAFTAMASASNSASATQQFSLTVNAAVPVITGVTQSGATATITGANLGTTGTVYFVINGSNVAVTATSWSPTQIVATIPGAGVQSVWVMVAAVPSAPFAFTPAPFAPPPPAITLSLASGPAQMGFTISGSGFGPAGFGPAQGASTVTIGGNPPSSINWAAQTITVQVPDFGPVPSAGKAVNVVVTVGVQSATAAFTVTNPFGCGN